MRLTLDSKHRLSRRGNVLVYGVVIMAIVAFAAVVIGDRVLGSKMSTFDDKAKLQLRLVAKDIVEIGKYLMLYDKVFFVEDPSGASMGEGYEMITGSLSAGGSAPLGLWGQNFGAVPTGSVSADPNIVKSCGGYINTNYSGDHKLNSEYVFCPMYLRSSMLSGGMMDGLLLQHYASGSKKIDGFSVGANGIYTLEIDAKPFMTSAKSSNYLKVFSDPKLLSAINNAKLKIEIFSNKAGFESDSSQRYIRISSSVVARGKKSDMRAEFSESLAYSLTVPRDFAVFLPYPQDENDNSTDDFFTAVKITGGSSNTVDFYGRVFFNGNINITNIADLPTFHDVVILSGDVLLNGRPLSIDFSQMAAIRDKFKKGFVSNFSAGRYLFDSALGSRPAITNGSSMTEGMGISNYISNIGNACSEGTYSISAGNSDTPSASEGVFLDDVDPNLGCRSPAGGMIPANVIQGGITGVVVKHIFAFIVSPVKKLEITVNNASIYGHIFGGHISAKSGAKFYSLKSLRVGLPGISNDAYLSSGTVSGKDFIGINSSAAEAYEGVTVPLLNFPLVYSTKDGMR